MQTDYRYYVRIKETNSSGVLVRDVLSMTTVKYERAVSYFNEQVSSAVLFGNGRKSLLLVDSDDKVYMDYKY